MIKSFGSDPELLIIKDNKPKSAIGVVNGDKANRINIDGHQFFYDNVLAEVAIKPGFSKEEVLHNIREALQIYHNIITPLKFEIQSAVIFPDSELLDPEAKEFGCDPEWDAYQVKIIESPKDDMQKSNMRSCGGHIHLGSEMLSDDDSPNPLLMLYMLDLFVGIPSLWLDKDPTSVLRRQFYGKAGRYRTKKYGIEYRSLSNFWLQSPRMTGLIYDLCMFAHDFVESDKASKIWIFDRDLFTQTQDVEKCWNCLMYNPKILQKCINENDISRKGFMMIINHYLPKELILEMQYLINDPEPKNLRKNWGIE